MQWKPDNVIHVSQNGSLYPEVLGQAVSRWEQGIKGRAKDREKDSDIGQEGG